MSVAVLLGAVLKVLAKPFLRSEIVQFGSYTVQYNCSVNCVEFMILTAKSRARVRVCVCVCLRVPGRVCACVLSTL